MSDTIIKVPEEQLEEAKKNYALIKTQLATKVLERQTKLLENFGEPWSVRYGQWQNWGVPITNADIFTDRTKVIRNVAQLNLAQNRAEDLAEANPNAAGICKAMKHYVVGSGSTFAVVSHDEDVEPPPVIKKKVNKLIHKFKKVNKWKELEADMERRLLVHGEFFLRIFADEDNVTKVRFVEPQQVITPNGESMWGDWSWGIKTLGEDTYNVLAYNIRDFKTVTDEEVPVSQIIHVKVNCLTNAKRGIPSFFSVDDELRGSTKVRWATREGEAVRRCITYFRRHPVGANVDAIEALANSLATDFVPPMETPTPSDAMPSGNSGDTIRVQKLNGPSVIDTGAEIDPPPNVPQEGSEIVVDMSLQAVASALQIPEWVVSGKTDVSSYAASLTTQHPFTKTIESDQDVLATATEECFERVIEIGIMQDEVPLNTLDEVHVKATYPSCVVQNRKEETERRSLLYDKKLLSGDTFITEEGYDAEHERAKILEEPQAQITPEPAPSRSNSPGAQYARAT